MCYIQNLIENNDITTTANTPASNNLFEKDESEKLQSEDQKELHTITAQLLYLGSELVFDLIF